MRLRAATVGLAVVLLLVLGCSRGASESRRPSERSLVTTPSIETTKPPVLDPHGNFVLYVSNQSFELSPVDIVIDIDGREVVNGDFAVGTQHNWKRFTLRLTPGRHSLSVRSTRGSAHLSRAFVVAGRRWAVVDFWYHSKGSPPRPNLFDFTLFNKPVKFA